jgi:hypothetical protein
MKPYSLLSLLLLLLCLSSCIKSTVPLTEYYPVLLTRESLEKSVTFHTPEPIKDPAKIYYKDNLIFISERYKGVHIIDNKDPKNPVVKGYIAIPGCLDMAIKGNTLYADNATDMVVLDLSNIGTSNFQVNKRVRNAFPELAPPDGKELPEKYKNGNRPENTVVIAWKK